MAQQLTVNSETASTQQEELDTMNILHSYVFQRARTDGSLTSEEVRMFDNAASESRGPQGSVEVAVEVGRKLADIGDEIDAQYQDDMKEIVRLTGSPESAFKMFTEVAKHVFEWDEQGGARINVGRIAALLAYCYHLCKAYLGQYATAGSLVSFLLMIGGWLFKFLLKAKFYEWLEKQGGWGQLLSSITGGWGNHAFLVIGIASLVIWAYSYFKR